MCLSIVREGNQVLLRIGATVVELALDTFLGGWEVREKLSEIRVSRLVGICNQLGSRSQEVKVQLSHTAVQHSPK